MTDSIFDKLLVDGVRAGQIPARTQSAREWYRDAAKNYGATIRQGGQEAGRIDYARLSERKVLKQEQHRLTNVVEVGSMYMYMYDPKYKEELPYYDRFPLIFPFRVMADRFWGINLHYLPLQHRAILMDALYGLRTNSRYDNSTKLRMSYQLLNGVAKYRYFKPCIKQYLKSHMHSLFMYVNPSEWDIALFLPLEKFVKKSKAQVWAETRRMV